jgi:hypothetical protein
MGAVTVLPSPPSAADSVANEEQTRRTGEAAGDQQGGQEQAGISRRIALAQLFDGLEQRKAEGPERAGPDQDQRGGDAGVHEKQKRRQDGGVSWDS